MLKRSDGMGAGVPVLRHALALAVLAIGAIEVSERFAAFRQSVVGIVIVIVPAMLLALAGFLIARSADRRTPLDMVVRRARRMLPPLAISLLVTMLGLGLFVSTDGLRAFFSSAQTWQYLGNLVGWTSDDLPGVFEFNNASGLVNHPLWMIPVTYAGCAIALVLARPASALRLAILLALFVGLAALAFAFDQQWLESYAIPRTFRSLVSAPGFAAGTGAVLGMIGFGWRRRIPVNTLLLVASVAVLGLVAFLFDAIGHTALGGVLIAAPASYVVLYLAVARIPTPPLLFRVNYSVGILLYGYPVEQVWSMTDIGGRSWLTNLGLSLPVTLILAAASWHFVERPLLAGGGGLSDYDVADAGGARLPLFRPVGWYVGRARDAVPALLLVLVFVVVILAVMAITMFALQRDPAGM